MDKKVRSLPSLPLVLSVGVLDLAESTACGSARRFGGASVGGASPRLGSEPRIRAPESRDQKDAPAWDTNESSTGAIQNGEGDLAK